MAIESQAERVSFLWAPRAILDMRIGGKRAYLYNAMKRFSGAKDAGARQAWRYERCAIGEPWKSSEEYEEVGSNKVLEICEFAQMLGTLAGYASGRRRLLSHDCPWIGMARLYSYMTLCGHSVLLCLIGIV